MAFPQKEVLRVAITGAAGQIAYSLVPLIARGEMLGAQQAVELRLLDLAPVEAVLNGVKMELEDCALPLLRGVVATADPEVAFEGADVIVMCGAFPRKAGMERKDLLEINAKIFSSQGEIVAKVAQPYCRVVVVGNPANTNALLLATAAKGFDPKNITALTRLDHNRALAQVAERLSVPVASVKNVIIWGNHSGTQVPDVTFVTASGKSVGEAVAADPFFAGDFVQTVQQRGAAVIKARGMSSAASAAKAIVDHVRDWILGTPAGTHVSMAVLSTGNPYGVPDGLMYSFPVTCKAGTWEIVTGLALTPEVAKLMELTTAELLEERQQAGIC